MSHVFCHAVPENGDRILEILESSPAKGSIELLYTRRPDAYRSYRKESDETFVYVVKDGEAIVGTVAEIVRPVYIGQTPRKTAYICGLKKDIHHPGMIHWGRAFFHGLVKEDIDCYFCSVVRENIAIRTMFEKDRSKTARMDRLQRYTTYMIAPYFRFKVKNNGYVFRRAEPADEQEIVDFLNRVGSTKDFFPVIEGLDHFADLRVEDFYMLKNEEGIIAAGALWNQSGYRQYIVKSYKGIMKIARCANPVLHRLGYIRLPKEGETIDFPMLSFFLSKDDNEMYYKIFLNHIVQVIRKNYDMFVIGTTESYFADAIYKKLRNVRFETDIYAVEFLLDGGRKQEICKDRLWLECGLL